MIVTHCPHCGLNLSKGKDYAAKAEYLYYQCPSCEGKWGRYAWGTRECSDAWRLHGVELTPAEARIKARGFRVTQG